MDRIKVNSLEELKESFGDDFYFDYKQPFCFENFDFNFDLLTNFRKLFELKHPNDNGSVANLFSSIKHYIFKNCCFRNELVLDGKYSTKLIFEKCDFFDLNFFETMFNQKIRFYNCNFFGNCIFENTKFDELIDFWNSTFHKKIIFFKTDFNKTAVFSACTFNENVLFTYSLFKEKAIFRGAFFEKGFDISLAINSGEYNFFNISLKNYKSKNYNSEEEYKNMIYDGRIPTENKKETFRIVKQHFQNIGDDLEYVKYLKLEKKPIFDLILKKIKKNKPIFFWNYFQYLFDLFSLFLNRISNNHRNSYVLGILFTISIGLLFFSISLLSLPEFTFYVDLNNWNEINLWKSYIAFMNPTHNIDLLTEYKPTSWTYFWQTWGRIFVGYGIYQTIQAYRKLR